MRPEAMRQNRHQPAELVSEPMLRQLGHQNVASSMISTLSNIGTSLAISEAWANDSTSRNVQPPTISLPSTNGPSVTAPARHTATAPPGLGPERGGECSRISLAYLDIQFFHCM